MGSRLFNYLYERLVILYVPNFIPRLCDKRKKWDLGTRKYILMFISAYVASSHPHRITITKDTKVPNAAIFTVNKEDHTLGNLLMR